MERKPVILVVDDELDNLELAEVVLSSEGFEIWTASSGLEALKILERRIPDLILLDVKMPKINGLDVCQKIRASSNPKLASLAIIMFSARDSADFVQQVKDVGAQDYVIKPFDFDSLVESIKEHLGLI